MTTASDNLVCGHQVQCDRSGVGHCWVNVMADDIPGQIRMAIEAEIIEAAKDAIANN